MRKALTYLLLFSLLGFAPCAHADDASRLQQRIKAQLAEENKGNMIFVSAGELAQAYQDNEIAADQTYKGKWVEVDGVILSVSKTWGKITVSLAADEYGINRVQARLFPQQIGEVHADKTITAVSDEELAATLRKGQTIKVDGRCTGATMGFPHLKDCVLMVQ